MRKNKSSRKIFARAQDSLAAGIPSLSRTREYPLRALRGVQFLGPSATQRAGGLAMSSPSANRKIKQSRGRPARAEPHALHAGIRRSTDAEPNRASGHMCTSAARKDSMGKESLHAACLRRIAKRRGRQADTTWADCKSRPSRLICSVPETANHYGCAFPECLQKYEKIDFHLRAAVASGFYGPTATAAQEMKERNRHFGLLTALRFCARAWLSVF